MRRFLMRLGTIAIITSSFAAVLGALSLQAPEQFFRTNLGRLDASQPITVYVEDGVDVPGYKSSDQELAKMALDAWSRESGGKLRFTNVNDPKTALVRLEWTSPNSGLFGVTERILVEGKPGAIVFVIPDVDQLGEALAARTSTDPLLRDAIVYLTCVHELGHAVGLPHTNKFEDIMYSFGYGGDIVAYFMRYRNKLQSRQDIARVSGLSPADVEFLRRLYSDQ